VSQKNPIFVDFDKFYVENPATFHKKAKKIPNFAEYARSESTETKVEVMTEKTITMVINEKYRVNLICTPLQIEAYIIGYLICEGIIHALSEVKTVEYRNKNEFWCQIETSDSKRWEEIEMRTSGCIGFKPKAISPAIVMESNLKLTPKTIFQAQKELLNTSTYWKRTGGAHMSSLFDSKGVLKYISEDVGRHNTIDKIIGEAILNHEDMSKLFAVISGRLSSAMITKLVQARIAIVISKAAPLLEGLEYGKKAKMTIIGFCREPEINIYEGAERILL
jgi:FdhD protein